uniref:Uncharacterized protein n=1 Tax=Avena sativa TaxID=4498 RepID=A0ACD5Y1V3_AVESA
MISVRRNVAACRAFCGSHKLDCDGTYVLTRSPETPGQQMVPNGRQGFLTEMSKMLKSQGAAEESDSDEVQENFTVAELIAESKLLSQVGGRNAKSPGSSFSKEASKSNMPEDSIVLPATTRRKLKPKQEFVATEKNELFSMVSCNNAKSLGSCSSNKKAVVVSAPTLSKLKRKQASEKHELISVGSWNNAKSLRSDTSRKAGKWQELEHAQKSSVQPSATQKKVKLEQDLGVPEKYGVFSLGSCNKAKPSGSSMSRKTEKRIKREGVEKSTVPLATPLKKLKLEHDLVDKHGDTKPLGNSTGNKEGRLHKPEGIQKASVIPADPPRKLKQDLVASEKNDISSSVGRSNANVLDNISSKNAHKQGDLATPLEKLKLEHDLVDQHGGTKPLGGSTGNKLGKLHKPEGIQKASVLPAAPPRRLKQDLVASEKNGLSSFVGRRNANVLDSISSKKEHSQREHEETRKPIARPPAPPSILKQQSKTNSSTKAGKQQIPECFQRTFVQPAVSQSKRKQSNHVVLERPKTRSKTSNPARKKEYACVSVWANIYESECSSGSAEPLVNKRTERRKRVRERSVQITYSRSRKRSASGISPIKAQPAAAKEETSFQQGKPPTQSQCLQFIPINSAVTQDPRDQSQPPATSMDIVGVPPADKAKTQTPRGHSQLPAQCMDIDIPPADLVTTQTHGGPSIRSTCTGTAIVPPTDHVMTQPPVHQSRSPAPCSIATDLVVPADPPSLTPLNPSTSPDVIDISDDD